MAWEHGSSKQARFEKSQIKKSINAGLIRIPAGDEIVMSSDFKGTFDQFVDRQLNYVSFSDAVYSTKSSLKECRESAIEMIHSNALKLASGEEIRKYVPRVFGQK